MTSTKKVKAETDVALWKTKAEECLTGWQRTQADFDNYRKRTETAKDEWLRVARADSLLAVGGVIDDFRRAFAHVPPNQQDSPWVAGMRQVEKHLQLLLAEQGLEAIEASGSFNPTRHEAIAYENHPELPDGSIIDTVEIGWSVGGKVLKPARVRVSKGQASD